jgi:hypothetical protein
LVDTYIAPCQTIYVAESSQATVALKNLPAQRSQTKSQLDDLAALLEKR